MERFWGRQSCQTCAIATSAPKNAGGITAGLWPQPRWNGKWSQVIRWVTRPTLDQPCRIKNNGREGEVLDEDMAGEEDLKQVTLKSWSKISLELNMTEEGAVSVEHYKKDTCRLGWEWEGQPCSCSAWAGTVWWFLSHSGWWIDLKADFSGLSNNKTFSPLFSGENHSFSLRQQ